MLGNAEMKVTVLLGHHERNLKHMCMGGYMCMSAEATFASKDTEGRAGNSTLRAFTMVSSRTNCS